MKALRQIARAILFVLVLVLPIYILQSEKAFERRIDTLIIQNRKYTDAKVLESQTQTLGAIQDVSRATRTLAIIMGERKGSPLPPPEHGDPNQ
jgi:hypothetical protein